MPFHIKLAAKIVLWTVFAAALLLAAVRLYGFVRDVIDAKGDIPKVWGWLSVLSPETIVLLAIALGAGAIATFDSWWPALRQLAGHPSPPETVEPRSSLSEVRRDTPLAEAIAFMAFGVWGKSMVEAATSEDVDAAWALKLYRQGAADGEVQTWGIGNGRVYEPIPKEYWLSHEIEWFELLKGRPYSTSFYPNERNQRKYFHLMTSRADAERLHRAQPDSLLRAKKTARALSALVKEGVGERNKLLVA
jgi:hypothetical protein